MNDISNNSAAETGKPVVFLLTLGDEQTQLTFQESHARFLNELFSAATVWHAKTVEKAFSFFTQCAEPHAVFVADGGIGHPKCEVVSQRLVQYAASGGLVVFGGSFAATDQPKLEKILKQTWDLPWTFGFVHRAMLRLNSRAVPSTLKSKLPASYSQTALHIRGMQPCEAWYVPTDYSVVENTGLRSVMDFGESPILFARYGTGHVGYVGDVLPENNTILVTLAMLGLVNE